MIKKNLVGKVVAVGVLLTGIAQADIINLTKVLDQHVTTTWQSLGKEKIKITEKADKNSNVLETGLNQTNENSLGFSYLSFNDRNRYNQDETSNNGLTWTWDDEDGDGHISVDESVHLTFEMFKAAEGSHDYDALMVWVDDKVYSKTWTVNKSLGNKIVNTSDYVTFDMSFDEAKDYDLTARVVCSYDLGKLKIGNYADPLEYWADNPDTKFAWNYSNSDYPTITKIGQGEREDYRITVGTQNVPEPTMLSLFGLGLLGLLAIRRKKS